MNFTFLIHATLWLSTSDVTPDVAQQLRLFFSFVVVVLSTVIKSTVLLFQAVCDAFLRFTHVDARWPGSSNDAYVLRRSLIGMEGEAGTFQGHWLLGDSG